MTPDHPDGLPADVRDRMVGILTAALTDAWNAALAAGAAPDDLAEIVADRRRAVAPPPGAEPTP
ncbi:hypothetical protein O7606_04230 [Micromonospora sp. WMMD882]|uniref:hypothetical protein n=1 Tax=Micromonospora sp. WMMD882 TaxID=3015151 RepID=UPI00248CEC87|nr:hypothetical protein [Micromonospora sp. WMMD882]WBB80605.1 hypothetical protein O7606_04230 [Micromonospora sp. WMMD882]